VRFTWVRVGALVINLAIVACMIAALVDSHHKR